MNATPNHATKKNVTLNSVAKIVTLNHATKKNVALYNVASDHPELMKKLMEQLGVTLHELADLLVTNQSQNLTNIFYKLLL